MISIVLLFVFFFVLGNMFECNLNHDDLPNHDSKESNYSCGSDVVNISIIVWIALLTSFVLMTFLFIRVYSWHSSNRNKDHSLSSSPERSSNQTLTLLTFLRQIFVYWNYVSSLHKNSETFNNYLTGLSFYLYSIRKMAFLLTLFIFCILLPVYATVSFYFSLFAYPNAWNISALLLSGETPAIVLMILFFLLLCLIVFLFRQFQAITIISNEAIKVNRRLSIQEGRSTYLSYQLKNSSLPGKLDDDETGKAFERSSSSVFFQSSQLASRFTLTLPPHLRRISTDGRASAPLSSLQHYQQQQPQPHLVYGGSNQRYHSQQLQHQRHLHGYSFSGSNNNSILYPQPQSIANQNPQRNTEEDSLKQKQQKNRQSILNVLIFIIISIIDGGIMMAADIFYVYILLGYSTGVIIVAELFLAFFKLFLNNHGIWLAIPWFRKRFYSTFLSEIYSKEFPDTTSRMSTSSEITDSSLFHNSSNYAQYHYSSLDISFITVLILFNNMFFPIIAILIISPECFYNALFEPSAITSSYTYSFCNHGVEVTADRSSVPLKFVQCSGSIPYTQTSVYSPPYIYPYECASTAVLNYVPVFIIMFTMEGIIMPVLKLALAWLYQNHLTKEQQSQSLPVHDVVTVRDDGEEKESCGSESSADVHDGENSSLGSSNVPQHATHGRQTFDMILRPSHKTRPTDHSNRSSTFHLKSVSGRTLVMCCFNYLLPDHWKELSPHSPVAHLPNQYFVLFNKDKLAVRLNAYFVVMMSFGALFPPLALIICVTVVTVTVYEEAYIGRLLFESEKLGYHWYRKQLEKDCHGITGSSKYTLWSLIPVASLTYAYIIFDTWGDDKGWKSALSPSILMTFLPMLGLMFLTILDYWKEKDFMRRETHSVPETSPPVSLIYLMWNRVFALCFQDTSVADVSVTRNMQKSEPVSSTIHQETLGPNRELSEATENPLVSGRVEE
jgi:hypothetical protein